MSILDELLSATKLELPTPVTAKFWEKLVRAVADSTTVDSDAWEALSGTAQEWANNGMRAITARKLKSLARSGRGKWTGDAKTLKIVPIETSDDPEPTLDTEAEDGFEPQPELELPPKAAAPAPQKRDKPATGKKRPSRKKTSRKKSSNSNAARQPRKTLRPAAFHTGRCYSFVRQLVRDVTTLEECDPVLLLERFKGPGAGLTVSGASTMMYDAIAVLRALRDLKLYSHPIVAELSRATGK